MSTPNLAVTVTKLYGLLEPLEAADRAKAVRGVLAMLGEDKLTVGGEAQSAVRGGQPAARGPRDAGSVVTLVRYLKDRQAEVKPNRRFLATAQWLHGRGQESVSLQDVTKAIKAAQLGKFSNPSVFMSNNIKSGFMEGNSAGFFVTGEGRAELGVE